LHKNLDFWLLQKNIIISHKESQFYLVTLIFTKNLFALYTNCEPWNELQCHDFSLSLTGHLSDAQSYFEISLQQRKVTFLPSGCVLVPGLWSIWTSYALCEIWAYDLHPPVVLHGLWSQGRMHIWLTCYISCVIPCLGSHPKDPSPSYHLITHTHTHMHHQHTPTNTLKIIEFTLAKTETTSISSLFRASEKTYLLSCPYSLI
jgi:hypothetical protein